MGDIAIAVCHQDPLTKLVVGEGLEVGVALPALQAYSREQVAAEIIAIVQGLAIGIGETDQAAGHPRSSAMGP